MRNAQKFKNTDTPRQSGERARLKVVQGPDYGSIYVLSGTRVVLGRGEDADVMIGDLKASRKHAEIALDTTNAWSVRDLGSANGILVNGQNVRASKLKSSDTILLGDTTFEFFPSDAGTRVLVAPPKTPEKIRSEQAALASQKEKVRSFGKAGGLGNHPVFPSSTSKLQPRQLILGVLGLALVGMFVFEDSFNKPKAQVQKKQNQQRDLASYLPSVDPSGSTNKTAEMFFKSGFREFREKNYLRARSQFETVLQIAPGHALSRIYLENANKAIEDEVKFHLERGKKGAVAGKLKEARGHFQAVMRLLHHDQANVNFGEAREQLEKVEKEIRGEATG
jgi:pSer/pThr/pTyr-binding forkhead associated (FHA) protein